MDTDPTPLDPAPMALRRKHLATRIIGAAIGRAATEAGLTYRMLGDGIGISVATVCRMIKAQRATPIEDIAAALALCGVTGRKRAHLLWIAKQRHQHHDGLLLNYATPDRVDRTPLTHLEATATDITAVTPTGLPDLLTPDATPPARVQCAFLITRTALTHPPGNRAERLAHLAALTHNPDITIRVTDTTPDGEPYQLLGLPNNTAAVAIRTRTCLLLVDNPDTLTTYTHHARAAFAGAYDRDTTHALIRRLAN
ncbi:Scr1 family TA system antitoxin-like transcriptional regulator [Actinokineospora sp. HUAS TT18]|uniref:Scr1 family TA system antitoxin-like transcriptional regulator n=1 Tax=Actinokineospora sp. HUAS TT18 TaxID=3447451 RepID=UPI003F52412E